MVPCGMTEARELSDLQLTILSILWGAPDSTVAEVHAAMTGRGRPSRQTVNTLLWRMERRGLVSRKLRNGQACYRASISRHRVLAERLGGVLSALFDTGAAAAALQETDVGAGDVKRLRALLRRAERDLAAGAGKRGGRGER